MSVSGGWNGFPTKPLRPRNLRPRRSRAGRNENLAMLPLLRLSGRDGEHAGRFFFADRTVRNRPGKLAQEILADVGLGERVEVAALQRPILDHRPMERLPLLAEDGQGGIAELHSCALPRPPSIARARSLRERKPPRSPDPGTRTASDPG